MTAKPRMPASHLPDAHAASLAESTALSANQVPGMIAPLDIVAALNQARVNFVLVGAHGLSGWVADPRATRDVDVVVMSRHLKRATRALLEAFPHLEIVEYAAVIRFRDRTSGKMVIAVFPGGGNDLLEMVRKVQAGEKLSL